jgi:hypothetical protein
MKSISFLATVFVLTTAMQTYAGGGVSGITDQLCGRIIGYGAQAHSAPVTADLQNSDLASFSAEFIKYDDKSTYGGIPVKRGLEGALMNAYSSNAKVCVTRKQHSQDDTTMVIDRIQVGNYLWDLPPLPR